MAEMILSPQRGAKVRVQEDQIEIYNLPRGLWLMEKQKRCGFRGYLWLDPRIQQLEKREKNSLMFALAARITHIPF